MIDIGGAKDCTLKRARCRTDFVRPFRKRNLQPDVSFLASAGVRSLRSQIHPVVPVTYKTPPHADRTAFRTRCSVAAKLEPQLRQIERRGRSTGARARTGLKFVNVKSSRLLNNPSPGDFLAGSLATDRKVFRAAGTPYPCRPRDRERQTTEHRDAGKQPVPILQPILGRRRVGSRTVA